MRIRMDRSIKYEVNFSQNMTVNTQARDAIDTDIYRVIDYLSNAIADVDEVESRIANANKMIANTTDPDELEKLNAYKESLETEKSLRVTVMTEAFGKGLTMVDTTQKKLNVAVADLGTRYDRLKLTSDVSLQIRRLMLKSSFPTMRMLIFRMPISI